MFLLDRKLEARAEELREYRYRDVIHMEELLSQEDKQGIVNPIVPTRFEDWNIIKVGDTWTGRDRYLWLHKEVMIPSEWNGKEVLGIFDYGNTGAGNNSGFESLLYLNEKPYQGVDSNHKEVFLNQDTIGTEVSFTFRLWSGLEGGGVPTPQEHKIQRADLAWLDKKVDDLYYLSSMIVGTIQILEEQNPIRHQLRRALDEAFKVIDWSYPGDENFYNSLYKADELLNQSIDAMEKDSLVNVKCVGHTHIDVAWLWRLKHTREKCSRSFSTVLRLMERYPEYIFLQTQPQLYEYIKQDFPELYENIKEKIASNQWEVDGGMWVEADCNLTSGESLTRQLLIGSRFIKEEFGKEVEYLWLPDVFGYSWALPQILKKSGIDMFMTTKISWNQYNRMPHDTFKWIGIDGSEVLTHFITTPEPGNTPDSWFYTYNGQLLPKTVKGVWDSYKDKNVNQELLIAYGYGDGGGGVNRDTLEQRRVIDKIPGLPTLKTSTAKEYFRNLKKTINETDQYVHTWDGELYLEYHRGTYTSHAYNKKMNRKMELFYREAEWFSAMAAMLQGDIALAKQEELTKGWKILLTNQFHDIIPGSSILEVYEDSKLQYEEANKIAEQVKKEAEQCLIQAEEHTYTVVNNSNWDRTELVHLPIQTDGIFKGETGEILEAQKEKDGWGVWLKVPAMGFSTIFFEEKTDVLHMEDSPFKITENQIETPFYCICLNESGQITRLYDKEEKREVLPEGEKANVLQMFEDKPLGNDAWDIDLFYQEKCREVTELVQKEVVELNRIYVTIRMKWKYMSSTIEQDLTLYQKSRRIDFKTKVDYHERKQLMKVAFPVDIRTTYATYDIQYGNVKRPNHWNTSWDQARFETVAQKWVDLSEYNYGVSLLNDSKYGHDIKENVIRLTLLKAATHPDYEQDQGMHEFTYALLPHQGDFVKGETVKEAFALNQPFTVVEGKSIYSGKRFIDIDKEGVELDAIKQSEDKKYLVLRLHEYTGAKQTVTIRFAFPIKGYMESDLMERPIEALKEEQEIVLNIKPFEIKTILIQNP